MHNADFRLTFDEAAALIEAMGARVCHDVSGPVGALSGLLDLAESDGDGEAAVLAIDLAKVLTTRLRLLRSAVGGGELASILDLKHFLSGMVGAEKLQLDITTCSSGDGGRQNINALAPLLLLIGGAALPRGGVITIVEAAHGLRLGVIGTGAGWPPSLAACLSTLRPNLAAATNPREIFVVMACLAAHRRKLAITLVSATELTVTSTAEP